MHYGSIFILLALVLLFKFILLTIYFVYLLGDFFLADFFLASLVLADLLFLKSLHSLFPMLPLPLVALPSVPLSIPSALLSPPSVTAPLSFSHGPLCMVLASHTLIPTLMHMHEKQQLGSTCMKTPSWDPHT